ncbi:hypothetical protein EDD11_009170, partial [Mortierella claussenii]
MNPYFKKFMSKLNSGYKVPEFGLIQKALNRLKKLALISAVLNPAAASHGMYPRSGPEILLYGAKDQAFAAF